MSKLLSATRTEGITLFQLRSRRYFQTLSKAALVLIPLGLGSTALLEYRSMQRERKTNYAGMAIAIYGVVCLGVFLKFNTRLVKEIVLLPNRQIRVDTMGVLKPSQKVFDLDCLLPPVACTGSNADFQSLRIATDKGFERYWIAFKNSDLPSSAWERVLLLEIMQSNLHDPKKPLRVVK